MAFSDYLSIPFLVSLGITLLLVGFVGMFFTQRLQEQNHKINSMVGLVSAMAEEVNFIRNLLRSSQVANLDINGGSSTNEKLNEKNLIEVSDGEDNDDSDDESDDDESENESDDDSDNESDDEKENENQESNQDNDELIEQETDFSNIKVINIHDTSENFQHSLEEIENLNDDDCESESESESSESDESINLVEIDTNLDLNESTISLNLNNSSDQNNDLILVDYKKLSLNKLRSIVSEKGLSDDVNKLKKQDLLKLLEC